MNRSCTGISVKQALEDNLTKNELDVQKAKITRYRRR